MKKKILFAIMIIILGIMAFSVINASARTEGIYTYTVTNGKAQITDCSLSASGDIVIPSKLGGYPVTSIGRSAFEECSSLTSITLPNGVTSIGNYAFGNCYSLTDITLPDSVTSIGNHTFWGCDSLTSITIPDGVTSIGEYAFDSCDSLTSITLPDSVTSIGELAFRNCSSLTDITLPDSVTSIGRSAFSSCSSLTSITFPDSLTSIGDDAFEECSSLTSITLPDSLTSIGRSAFRNCSSLTSITLPDSLTSIGRSALYNCSSLTSITFPDSLTSIGDDAFYNCSGLTSITLPDSVTTIGDFAFRNCSSLTSITLPDGVTSIGRSAFDDTGFYNNSDNWENDVLYIGKHFISAKTTISGHYNIIDGTLTIAGSAFSGCSKLTSVTIPDGVTSIGDYAFRGCSKITSIILPDGVTSIGWFAFYDCSSLTSITLPDSVTSIGDYAFDDCSSLTSITLPDSITSIGGAAFDNTGFYNNSANWENDVLYIGKHCIEAKTTISGQYNIIDGTLTIADDAFYDCSSLKRIILPDSITSIGGAAFYNCSKLTSITIPDGVTSIEHNMFNGCSKLTSITIPDSVTSIGSFAFYNCSSLPSITIPDGVTSIGEYAFEYCSSLTSITIPDGITSIEWAAFAGCSGLTNIEIPDGVTTIEDYAFSDCNSLKSITIPDDVTSIGDKAFEASENIETVYYNGNPAQWNKINIGSDNGELTVATLRFFLYVTIIDANGNEISKKEYDINTLVDVSEIEESLGYSIQLFTDEKWKNEFELTTPITENLVLYVASPDRQLLLKFVNDDGTLIEEKTVGYGEEVTLPEEPTKAPTQQYSYRFRKWDGYTEGMKITDDMTFTAMYWTTLNKYTYNFVDNDGTVLKEIEADYGTVIETPDAPADKDPYTFDYWQGYEKGMKITGDISFEAVYKYKTYRIAVAGLNKTYNVVYNDAFKLEIYNPDNDLSFAGYFTNEGGKGTKITDENGDSIRNYNYPYDIIVYPYSYAYDMNKIELQGTTSVIPGDFVKGKAIFVTDKNITYLTATIKYPCFLDVANLSRKDFTEVSISPEKTTGEYKYSDITCVYDYEGNFADKNTKIVPFEIEFQVASDAPVGLCEIALENVTLIGDESYTVSNITNHTFEITPKLAESVEIIGETEIDCITQFSAVVLPDHTTDKSVIWEIDDESIATISPDGTVTPLKNGTITITATAKDGSGVAATKTVKVIAYAKIKSLDFGDGVTLTAFNPDIRKYTVYVKADADVITLTPTISGGVLRPNGSGIWVSGVAKEFTLEESGTTTITLHRESVTDMTNSIYIVEVIKYEGTKTAISDDRKTITAMPVNVPSGKTVILALFNGNMFAGFQKAVFDGIEITFTTDISYTNAKVMVWNNTATIVPVCNAENVQ